LEAQIFYKCGRLRIVIPTANLVDYDWRDIENVRISVSSSRLFDALPDCMGARYTSEAENYPSRYPSCGLCGELRACFEVAERWFRFGKPGE